LLESNWRVEDARPRRYYVISRAGRELLPQIKNEWNSLAQMLGKMLA